MLLSKTFNRTAFGLFLALTASVPVVASSGYVYLECTGNQLVKSRSGGTTQLNTTPYSVSITLDKENGYLRFGERASAGEWKNASFSGDKIKTETRKGTSYTSYWSLLRYDGRFMNTILNVSDHMTKEIHRSGSCRTQKPYNFKRD